ncbi:FAD-dependent oxidoreductase [Cohnella sp. REN36]|uniref:FAD-dependent oxidoreductase n=1 Tax=Cohnella sp. REN36 TaxID=2887347 RepID=UPI001D13B373|nr:FAD-dependent oxidoreductase [Cohnella sp. REN36]MCC3371920.1 FAD-dependent oxidoreductase [Cohnella sp. REN36]
MGFFKDLAAVFNKREMTFIDSFKESENIYSFLFEKDPDLHWEPGQYGLISITHKPIKNATKPFSLASAPAENVVRITTRIGDQPSEFKQALLELKPGMKIKMSGAIGSFSLKNNNPTLLIAGGIGITPFRSMLKQHAASGNGENKQIHLLYTDSKKSYLFKDELDALADRSVADVTYLDSRENLEKEIESFIARYKDNGTFFVAGPKSLVASVSAFLQGKKISKQKLKKDAFRGY